MDPSAPTVAADPAGPLARRFRSGAGEHLLVIPFSRIYDLPPATAAAFDPADPLVAALCAPSGGEVPLDRIEEPAPQSLSLNVSSSCNLGCTYCYAARGGFGGLQAAPMRWQTARAAVDRLLAVAEPSRPITIGFLGGEPFANRSLIHAAVAYAAAAGARLGLDVRFSVTTNGTLLRAPDLELLRRHPFAVTVSLDGPASVHDAQRPQHRGRSGSWARAVDRVAPLLAAPGCAKLAARATVTRHNFDLVGRLEVLAGLGFPEVGFSPLRVAPEAAGPLREQDWPCYLAALVRAARLELARLSRGLPIRLTNLGVALKQLHRGASSPYPCGAGGGYFSVAADGRWYACHRAIGQPAYELGSNAGLDGARRRRFVESRHVHAQTDCRSCWARYLCSGGCHQEAEARTAASCDFIRGWLDFCLATYCELRSHDGGIPT
jgi:uncharacterized protein